MRACRAAAVVTVMVLLTGAAPVAASEPSADAPVVAGSAARAAVEQFRAQPATAADALTRAIAAEPMIASALRVLLAEALLASGQRTAARQVAELVAEEAPRWAHRAHWIAARAAMPDDCKGAIAHIEEARVDPPWVQEARRLALLSSASAACGDRETGAGVDRALATRHPETPEGEAAARRVELTVDDRFARAEGFERARDYGAAEAVLRVLVDEVPDRARFAIAKLHLERIRQDFGQAERLFTEVAAGRSPLAEEALYLRARTRGRQGDVVGALGAYRDYLARFKKGKFVGDARFFSAFLLYEHRRYRDAARAFGELTRRGRWRKAARWYQAWSLYLAGEMAPAVPLLDAIAGPRPESRDQRQAAYWAARALEGRRPAEAAARRAKLVEARATDWYGLMIRRRHPKDFAPVAALPPPGPMQVTPVPPALLTRVVEVRALSAAGLPDFARRALVELSKPLRAADAWDAEVALAREVGDYNRVYRTTLRRHHPTLKRLPTADLAPIWRDAFPRAWPEHVRPTARLAGLDPGLVWSFMRLESAFDPDVVSHAHAVGLMQLLPRTAHAVVDARAGVRPGDESREGARAAVPDLFEPKPNIELGAWYLHALGQRFGGQVPLIGAAYNAGPRSVLSWFRGRSTVETDRFVDTIPFRETRAYVKTLIRTRVGYSITHEGVDLDAAAAVLPVELDLTVRPGVDF